VRRFGLFGSAHSLQVDIIQLGALPASDQESPSTVADALDQPLAAEAYELRTVRYEFVGATELEEAGPAGRPGLTRREFDFKTPPEPTAEAAVQEEAPAFDMAEDQTPGELSVLESLAPDPNDNTITWVPEVISLEFRYFDGYMWSSTWNSIQRKSLPAAVEVVVEINASDPLSLPALPGAQTSEARLSEEAQALLDQEAEPVSMPNSLTCRLVIDLPCSLLRNAAGETQPREDDFPTPIVEGPPSWDESWLAEEWDEDFDPTSPYAMVDEPPRRPPQSPRRPPPVRRERTVIQQRAADQWMRGGL